MSRVLNQFYERLWAPGSGDAARVSLIRRVLRLLYMVGRDVVQGTLTLRAMSLVYTTLLSTVPLLAFSFSVLKGFGVHNQLEPLLFKLMAPLGGKGEPLTRQIIGFVDNMQVGVLGALGLGLLIYTVISLLQKIESSLNHIWRVSTRRSFVQRFSEYLSVVLVGPVLVFTAMGITGSAMHTDWVERIAAVEPMRTMVAMAGTLVPYLLIIGAFTFVYAFVPHTKVRLRSALIGAAVAGTLWETAGWGFASFIANSTKYTAIYSGFAIVILAMIWIYLAWLILLIGASIAFYHQHPQYHLRRPDQLRLSIAEIERLAVLVMITIGRRYAAGRTPWSARQLATDLTAPLRETELVVHAISAAGLLISTDPNEPAFVPGRPLDLITVSDVLRAVRHYPDGNAWSVGDDSRSVSALVDEVIETLPAPADANIRGLLDDARTPMSKQATENEGQKTIG